MAASSTLRRTTKLSRGLAKTTLLRDCGRPTHSFQPYNTICGHQITPISPHSRVTTFLKHEQPFSSLPPRLSKCPDDWDDLSPERQLKWLLEPIGDEPPLKWGWVIYRICYNPEWDRTWEGFKESLVRDNLRAAASSDAPEIAEAMDWKFVEDRELEGASLRKLKRRFREWVAGEVPEVDVNRGEDVNLGSRYTFFVRVDEESLRSIFHGCGEPFPYVAIVKGWKDCLPLGEEEEEENEDWMKIPIGNLSPWFWVIMENDENWYYCYRAPSSGMAEWY